MHGTSLWLMCLLLFAEGGTLAFLTTPTLLYFSKYHAPWSVALAGSGSSALGSAVQLLLLRWALASGRSWMQRWAASRAKLEAALERYPSATFLALLLARATPLPDAPLKLVAALVGYPVWLYCVAVLLGALQYYWVLALVGKRFQIPNWMLLAAVAAIALGFLLDWLRRRRASAA